MPCSRSRSSFSRRMRICSGRSWVTSSVTRPKNTDLANCKSWSAPCKHRVLPIHHRAGRIGKEPDQRLKELRMIKQLAAGFLEIGRASCRERVSISEVAGADQKKTMQAK